jgi:hypothetical protein
MQISQVYWRYIKKAASDDWRKRRRQMCHVLCGISLECVSKCREMQFRGHQVAFQGEKPQAYWLQVKVIQHRNAA